MLNYFLLQLAGPQRKSLTVKDPEKYEFKPKQLLKQVSWRYITFLYFSALLLLLAPFHLHFCLYMVDCHHLCPYHKG